MSVSSAFRNEFREGRVAASRTDAPCPDGASAETKLGYIAERARATPAAEQIEALLRGIPTPRRAQVSAGLHAALGAKGLVGSSAHTCIDADERALCAVLMHAAASI